MKVSKTLTEKRNSTLNIENFFHQYDSYCCPYCTNLPEILSYNEGNGMIKFKCKKHGEDSLDMEEYIDNMKKFVSTSELYTKNKCSKHKNESFSHYCFTCQENLCPNCLKEFEKNHENHIKYNIESLRPNNNEILLIKNKIGIYLQKKDEYMKIIKNLDYKIAFYDALINSLEKQRPNYFLNINIKHLLYGENINLDEIIKDFHQKSGQSAFESKKEMFDDFVKNNFLKATEGLNQLNLVNKNLGDEFMNEIFAGIEKTTIFRILKFGGKISNPKEVIEIKNIKYLNLRGNKLTNFNFLLGKDCSSLEILSFNDNEITSIDDLKNINCPLLKELYLSKNKITSIDILKELKIKKLQILWLSENDITSIDVLKRVDFQQLRKLGLSKNNIKDISVFEKTKFPQLFELYINENDFDPDAYNELIEKLSFKIKEFYY
jgi:hypothetical protein